MDSLQPAGSHFHRFRFQFRDDRATAGGRGTVRIAAPDSLRFDVQGPLGSGRSAAFVVGDSAVWAEPEDDVKKLVPNYPLLWAMLGVPLRPADRARVRGYREAGIVAWQVVDGADTVDYLVRARTEGHEFVADVRHGSKRIGRVTMRWGGDHNPASARLVVPSAPARLDLTFYLSRVEEAFAPDTWVYIQP